MSTRKTKTKAKPTQLISPALYAAVAKSDIKAVIQLLVELKQTAQLSDACHLLGIRYVEQTIGDAVLAHTGWKSFDRFIKEQCNVRESRYRDFCHAYDTLGEAKLLQLGVDAAVELASVKSAPKQEKLEAAYMQWAIEHNGVKPSQERARAMRDAVDPRERPLQTANRAMEVIQLRAENAKLRADVRALTTERNKLAKENARLLVMLAKVEKQQPR